MLPSFRSLSFRNQRPRVWLWFVLLVIACLVVSAIPAHAQSANPTYCWGGWTESQSATPWTDLGLFAFGVALAFSLFWY